MYEPGRAGGAVSGLTDGVLAASEREREQWRREVADRAVAPLINERPANEEKREINCFICADVRGWAEAGGRPMHSRPAGRRHLISSLLRDAQTVSSRID